MSSEVVYGPRYKATTTRTRDTHKYKNGTEGVFTHDEPEELPWIFNRICALDQLHSKCSTKEISRRQRPRSAPPKSAGGGYSRKVTLASQYHERCGGEKSKAQPSQGKPPLTKAELRKADVISQDKIWKEAVAAESDAAKKWENNWGFLLEGDSTNKTGEPRDDFGTGVSGTSTVKTNAGNYGSRLNTEVGQQMMKLEFQLSHNLKKKKLSPEMICY